MTMIAARKSTPEQDLRVLFGLTRQLRENVPSLTERVEQLFPEVESLTLSPLEGWDLESLQHARHFAEELTIHYVLHFHNLKELPVTYYKREKVIRRRLDHEFSRLFQEIVRRAGREYKPELITEEPIYYLLQKARERSFPTSPRSKGKHPLLETLRIRLHVDLAARLDPDAREQEDRRVLLPFQIK